MQPRYRTGRAARWMGSTAIARETGAKLGTSGRWQMADLWCGWARLGWPSNRGSGELLISHSTPCFRQSSRGLKYPGSLALRREPSAFGSPDIIVIATPSRTTIDGMMGRPWPRPRGEGGQSPGSRCPKRSVPGGFVPGTTSGTSRLDHVTVASLTRMPRARGAEGSRHSLRRTQHLQDNMNHRH